MLFWISQKKTIFSSAKNVESTNVRAKMRALLRIINVRMTKNNISRIQKNFLIDIHVNLNRFCDIQQSILNVKRVETRLKSLILSKNDDEKSKSNSKTTLSSRSNSSRSSFSRFVWSLFVALMRKRIRWKCVEKTRNSSLSLRIVSGSRQARERATWSQLCFERVSNVQINSYIDLYDSHCSRNNRKKYIKNWTTLVSSRDNTWQHVICHVIA